MFVWNFLHKINSLLNCTKVSTNSNFNHILKSNSFKCCSNLLRGNFVTKLLYKRWSNGCIYRSITF